MARNPPDLQSRAMAVVCVTLVRALAECCRWWALGVITAGTMPGELDIYRTANLYIKKHGCLFQL
jgi:hypothetical protein